MLRRMTLIPMQERIFRAQDWWNSFPGGGGKCIYSCQIIYPPQPHHPRILRSVYDSYPTRGNRVEHHRFDWGIIIVYDPARQKLNQLYLSLQAGLKKVAKSIYALVGDVLSISKKPEAIQKQVEEVKQMARKINYRQWSDSIVWRPSQAHNESAMSALARQLMHGYEAICLSPSLLFRSVEQVADVIDNIRISVPIQALLQPCRLTPLLRLYPGLVHFVLIDRANHRMVSPVLALDPTDSTFNDVT